MEAPPGEPGRRGKAESEGVRNGHAAIIDSRLDPSDCPRNSQSVRNEKRRDPLRRGPRSGSGARGLSRREFVRTAASLAAGAVALSCGSEHPAASRARRTLKILQWSHFVPGYDEWFDHHYTKEWGARHDTEVIVDHMAVDRGQRARRGGGRRAARGTISSCSCPRPRPTRTRCIDHREVVEAVEKKHGKMLPLARPVDGNPKTGKVLRLLRLLRPRPGQLPHRSLGRSGLPERTGYLGGPPHRRGADQGEDSAIPVGIGLVAGDRLQHGSPRAALVLRRGRAGRAGARRDQLEGDDRGAPVRPRALPGDDDARGLHLGPVLEQPHDARRARLLRPERDLRDADRRRRKTATMARTDRARCRRSRGRPGASRPSTS